MLAEPMARAATATFFYDQLFVKEPGTTAPTRRCRTSTPTPGRYDIVQWASKPGDVIPHHPRTIHGAPGNRTMARRRRAITTRWLDDDAVHQHGSYSFIDAHVGTPPPFEVVEGEPLSGPLFPRVWPR